MYDTKKIVKEIESLPRFESQICLQSDESGDPFLGCGVNRNDTALVKKIFDTPVLNAIIDDHNLYRTRVMRMKPKTCYTYHQDPTKRLHVPVVTNDKCFLVVDDEVVRCAEIGKPYVIDTTKLHTAVNASTETRVHIVGCIPDSRRLFSYVS